MIHFRYIRHAWIVVLLLAGFCVNEGAGKRVKNSFAIEKSKGGKEKADSAKTIEGLEIVLADSVQCEKEGIKGIERINFAGYEKEPNSAKESFILVNPTDKKVTGFKVRIDYLDMQDRMLHSRELQQACEVPPGESRRFDIPSWDLQRTYYYYLGNSPKKVATPYKVKFDLQSIWVGSEQSVN